MKSRKLPISGGQGARDERADEYFTWKGERTAEDFVGYIKNVRGTIKLSHSGILKDASISESLARSNPFIKGDLLDMEKKLREQGHLPSDKKSPNETTPDNKPTKPARSALD